MQEDTYYKYNQNQKSNMNQVGSSSTNGICNRMSLGTGNGREDDFLQGERHHLLNLTDSDVNDSLEDLGLPMPPISGVHHVGILSHGKGLKSSAGAITNGVTTAAGRIRRKIRLKRYDDFFSKVIDLIITKLKSFENIIQFYISFIQKAKR